MIHQSQVLNHRDTLAVLLGTQVGGEEPAKLDQRVQALERKQVVSLNAMKQYIETTQPKKITNVLRDPLHKTVDVGSTGGRGYV